MKNLLCLALFFTLFLNSCITPVETATLFVPNKPTYHLLEKKKDYRAEGGFKIFDFFHEGLISGELQLAYAPIKYVGVIGNYSYINTDLKGFEKRKLQFGETGLNFYVPIPHGKNKHHVLELVTAYGVGKATDFRENHIPGNSFQIPIEDRFYAKSNRIFAQLNYGFEYRSTGKFRIAVGPSIRISRLNIYEIEHISSVRPLILENPTINMLSIGVNFQMGSEHILFTSHFSLEGASNEEDQLLYDKYIDARGSGLFNLYVGMKARF